MAAIERVATHQGWCNRVNSRYREGGHSSGMAINIRGVPLYSLSLSCILTEESVIT